jgi:hypothetical protein
MVMKNRGGSTRKWIFLKKPVEIDVDIDENNVHELVNENDLEKTILYDVPDLNETVLYDVPADLIPKYANKEKSGDGGRGVTTNSEGSTEVGQPAGLPNPYANKDKSGDVERGGVGDLGQSKEKAPVIYMEGNKAASGTKSTPMDMRRSTRARKIPARYRE